MATFAAEISEHTVDVATVLLQGDLDLASVDQLRQALAGVGPEPRRVVLDLRGLAFLDSSGLNVLIRTHVRFREQGRELVLTGATGMVETVLGMTGLDRFVDRPL